MAKPRRVFTEEEKKRIVSDYLTSHIPVKEVRERNGISGKQLNEILVEAGVEFRLPSAHHAKKRTTAAPKIKTCPKCRRRINLKDARFCPYCATDIRSEADILIEEVQTLYSYTRFLPADIADRAGETIIKVMDYLKKEVK